MTTLLIKHAHIATMDDHQREIPDGGLFIRDGFIEQVGPTADCPPPPMKSSTSAGTSSCPGWSTPTITSTRPSRAPSRPRRMPTCSTGSKRSTPSGRASPPRIFSPPRRPPSPNWHSQAAPPPQTIFTSSPTAQNWMMRSKRAAPSGCVCTPHADQCPWANRRADCPPTRLPIKKISSWPTAPASSSATTTPNREP